MVVDGTPIERHDVGGVPVLVKREDQCCPFPGPAFSKMRGVEAHLRRRPESIIGVLDTYHSKAGWAVSQVCRDLGKRCIDYWPRYKSDHPDMLRETQRMAAEAGATLVSLPAGRSAILYHQASEAHRRLPDSYMIANALKLAESVEENCAEATRTIPLLPARGTVVISISSGTIVAGILQAFALAGADYQFLLHMGYSRSVEACRAYIEQQACCWEPLPVMTFVDEGYGYADRVDVPAPFPTNPYYDLKAWKWLAEDGCAERLASRGAVVFWNIGA